MHFMPMISPILSTRSLGSSAGSGITGPTSSVFMTQPQMMAMASGLPQQGMMPLHAVPITVLEKLLLKRPLRNFASIRPRADRGAEDK